MHNYFASKWQLGIIWLLFRQTWQARGKFKDNEMAITWFVYVRVDIYNLTSDFRASFVIVFIGSSMASGGERTFREYAISPYGYETMAECAETGEGAGNSAQSDNISEVSEDSHRETATQTG